MTLRLLAAATALGLTATTLALAVATDNRADEVVILAPANFPLEHREVPPATTGPHAI